MSRGPNVRQRQMRNALPAENGAGVVITGLELHHADNASLRRATVQLEAACRRRLTVHYVDGRRRLVAHTFDHSQPAATFTHGIDGMNYRRSDPPPPPVEPVGADYRAT